MILSDANLLIYAYNEAAPENIKAKKWLEEALSSPEIFYLSWQTITAFLRITTNGRAFPSPFDPKEAIEIVDEWLTLPQVVVLRHTDEHWPIFREVILEGKTTGPLMMDAHLATLAIENGATLATTDRDFTRFSKLKTINPMEN